jgi:hypothetical protein
MMVVSVEIGMVALVQLLFFEVMILLSVLQMSLIVVVEWADDDVVPWMRKACSPTKEERFSLHEGRLDLIRCLIKELV